MDFDYSDQVYTNCKIRTCRVDSDSWEPDDEVKGDVARMLFYMAVRYEKGDRVDLELNEKVNNGKNPYHGKLSVLLEWHKLDPVSDAERRRNEIIYEKYQYNRNPFIDYPEFADMIFNQGSYKKNRQRVELLDAGLVTEAIAFVDELLIEIDLTSLRREEYL